MPIFQEDKQNKKIQDIRKREEEDLARILSSKYGLGYADLSTISINTDALRILDEVKARELRVAIFDKLGRKIKVAVKSPSDFRVQELLKKLEETGYSVSAYMVSNASIEKALSRYADLSFAIKTEAGVLDISDKDLSESVEEFKNLEDIQSALEIIKNSDKTHKVSKFFETIIASAVAVGSSDIHIEPEEDQVRIRYRFDGILNDIIDIDSQMFDKIISRIKLIGGLKLNIKAEAQDGRFSIKALGKDIEIRLSTIPGSFGESVVMRILDPDAISVKMKDLGMREDVYRILEKEIKKPNGLILNTGPTGSGKTTTLYAFLKEVHNPNIKIITIENPVEYKLEGIVQTQTDRKRDYTFAKGLRAILRQDPDVIMVGEIRDEETAEVAADASLTGHLVLSTLHTNTAAGSFPRLVSLGLNPKTFGSFINAVMAQRLVRKLCVYCREEIEIDQKHKEIIKKQLDNVPNIDIKDEGKVFKAVGCDKCNHTGYKGRIGIFEVILINDNIDKIIRENGSEREIRKEIKKEGMLSIVQDGILKVLDGVTSFEELERVVDIEDFID